MWLAAAGVRAGAREESGRAHQALLEAAAWEELCKTFELPEPLRLSIGAVEDQTAEFTQARVVARSRHVARIELICAEESEVSTRSSGLESCFEVQGQLHASKSNCTEIDIRWQDVSQEAAAIEVLRLLNACWASANVTVLGLPVSALTYTVQPLGTSVGLVEIVPGSRTLGELKRTFVKGDAAQRVTDHLGCDPSRLARLAATTAALLASNYILGAAAGDGDNLLLAHDGTLFRVDFGYLFGSHPTVAGLVPFDAPVVWLPCAVTTALAERWPEVQLAALQAFQVGITACSLMPPSQVLPSAPLLDIVALVSLWSRAQAVLYRVESDQHLPIESYLASLSEAEFISALHAVDSTFRKKLKTFLHDAFGYRSRVTNSSGIEDSRCCSPGKVGEAASIRASDLEAEVWRMAVCTVACMCQDETTSARLFERVAWCHLGAAALAADFRGRRSVLQALVTVSKRGTQSVKSWMMKASSHCHRYTQFLTSLSERIRSKANESASGAIEARALPECWDTDWSMASQLEQGAVCAVARVALSAALGWPHHSWPTMRQRETHFDLGPGADDRTFAQRSAARVLVGTLMSEECIQFAAEVLKHADGPKMAAATRALDTNTRADFLRAVERLAKEPSTSSASNQEVRAWARSCLVAAAQDEDGSVSRPAVCVIACAVDDEDPELQQWAREFLTAAAWDKDANSACSPVHALMRMAESPTTTFEGSNAATATTLLPKPLLDPFSPPNCTSEVQ